MIKEYSFFIGH